MMISSFTSRKKNLQKLISVRVDEACLQIVCKFYKMKKASEWKPFITN